MKTLTHSGYFEGIGGFSLGAYWAGIKTVYTCELHELRHEFLKAIHPNIKHERDITTAKGKKADIFTAGFPCQDISQANGNAQGITGQRSSLIFPFLKIVSIHRPRYVVLENSPVLTRRGLREILTEFAKIGYDAEWQIISKRSLGFEDERERCMVVAYPREVRRNAKLQVFNRVSYDYGKKALEQRINVEYQSDGAYSYPLSNETIHSLLCRDDGIPFNVAQPYIEAYGDAISPQMAQLVFEMINIHYQYVNQ